MREQAIAEFHELLQSDEDLTAGLFARLRGAMRERRLVYGGREIGVSLRPHLLDAAQYARLVHASETLAGAFEKMSEAFVAEPRLLASVGMTEAETRLALVEPGYRCPSVTGRLDAFVHGDEVKFVEYNAENPSSLHDQAGLNEVGFEVAAMRHVARRYRLRQFDPAAALFDALVETYAEWSGARDVPNVAIVDWDGLPTAGEFELLREYFEARGVPAVVCSPDGLEYDGRRLRAGDFKIDLVYKRVIIHELLAERGESHAVLRAYAEGRVCLVNSPRCKPLHKKAAFELLTGEWGGRSLTPAEREVVRSCVPWTRRVSERRTTRGGESVDLVEHVRRGRASFMLKPNDDYGGRGLVFGARSTEAEWDAALSHALEADFVVQETLTLHTEVFPVFGETSWALRPMYVDTNPFLFRGRVEGAMVRLSGSPVVNVTSGGGEAGLFVVEGRLES
ncbi:MAG: glutathionylspermidine synthase family protein [Acidobacteria bacterium]|nr:glutathionylspermidine synthase family protein [Acidobacteriota bacterium]